MNALSTSDIASVTPSVEEVVVPTVPAEENERVIVSDLATTSAPLGSIAIKNSGIGGTSPDGGVLRPLGFFNRLISSPHMVIGLLYLLLSSFVIVSLVSAMVFAWRRHSGVHMIYSAGLVASMFLLFYIHVAITGGALIV
jgi:hypothetical protein